MKIDPANADMFDADAALPVAADVLFLPAIEAVVKHIARVLAEQDYKQFVATGEIPYNDDAPKEGARR